jgi:hypothetical protein
MSGTGRGSLLAYELRPSDEICPECPVRLRDLNTAERVLRQMQINLAEIVREQVACRKDQFFSK